MNKSILTSLLTRRKTPRPRRHVFQYMNVRPPRVVNLNDGQTDYGGLFGERLVDSNPATGLFLYEVAIPFKDINDGLSYTLAVAEDVGGPDSEWINGRNVFVQAHGINDSEAWAGDNEIRSLHGGGAMLLYSDGHTQFLTENVDKQVLGALITRRRGEVIPGDVF